MAQSASKIAETLSKDKKRKKKWNQKMTAACPDDLIAVASIDQLKKWWDELCSLGPKEKNALNPCSNTLA